MTLNYPSDVVFIKNIPFVVFTKANSNIYKRPFTDVINDEAPIEIIELTKVKIKNHTPPAGFIYHQAYCGSTLVAQMFSEVNEYRAVSEALIINKILDNSYGCKESEKKLFANYFKLCVSLFNDVTAKQQLILKFTSWNIFNFEIIRLAFPSVPWIFLYRYAIEMMHSVKDKNNDFKKMYKYSTNKACDFLDVSEAEFNKMGEIEFNTKFIAAKEKHAIIHIKKGGLFVNLNELPSAVYSKICPHFNIVLSNRQKEILVNRGKYNSKRDLHIEFTPKKYINDEKIEKAALKWLQPCVNEIKLISKG